MKVKIKKINGELIYSGEAGSVKDCVENLVRDGVDLSFADLSHVDLNDAELNGAEISGFCRMDFGGWSICIGVNRTTIGCQCRSNRFWLKVDTKDVASMDTGASEFWENYGVAIKAVIECMVSLDKNGRGFK